MLLWPRKGERIGYPARLNAPVVFWVWPGKKWANDVDRSIRIFGKTLSLSDREPLVVVQRGEDRPLSVGVVEKTAYEIKAELPERYAAGDYTVWVHNGTGGRYGWSEAGRFTVAAKTYNTSADADWLLQHLELPHGIPSHDTLPDDDPSENAENLLLLLGRQFLPSGLRPRRRGGDSRYAGHGRSSVIRIRNRHHSASSNKAEIPTTGREDSCSRGIRPRTVPSVDGVSAGSAESPAAAGAVLPDPAPHAPARPRGNVLPFLKALGLLSDSNFLVFLIVAFLLATQLQFSFWARRRTCRTWACRGGPSLLVMAALFRG